MSSKINLIENPRNQEPLILASKFRKFFRKIDEKFDAMIVVGNPQTVPDYNSRRLAKAILLTLTLQYDAPKIIVSPSLDGGVKLELSFNDSTATIIVSNCTYPKRKKCLTRLFINLNNYQARNFVYNYSNISTIFEDVKVHLGLSLNEKKSKRK